MMYFHPELFGGEECTRHCSQQELDACKDECTFRNCPCDQDIFELCNIIMNEHHLHKTNDANGRKNLYLVLRREILSLLP
jgi:hypothetical protein